TLEDVIYKMSINPRKIINRPVIHIKKGDEANFTIIDQGRKWKVDKTKFQSKSNNTPFHGWQLQGRCVAVINHGQLFVCAPEDIKIEEK
ncbi:dihydroorotase, partial [bacterium]|nr:dihydroorotase [bacterium]